MKKTILPILICIAGLYNALAQTGLTAADWQSDLRFLQETVHKDYPFLFKKTTPEKFDAAVEQLYSDIPKLQEHEIEVGLARLVSSFEYGHTALSLRRGPVKFHQLPINLYYFSDGVYVEGVHKDYKEALGAKVIDIEGKPVEQALEAIRAVVPTENDMYLKGYGIPYLLIPEILHAQGITPKLKQSITFKLERNGKIFEQTVAATEIMDHPLDYGFAQQTGDWLTIRDQSKTPLYLKNLDKNYFYEYLPQQKTVYVRHSQVLDDQQQATIKDFYNGVFDFIEKNEVERLVIDVRLNGGGNNYKNKPVITGIIRTQKINQPGKLFVIIGRRTFSACQNLVNEMSNYTNAVFVGEPTGENINFYGDNNRIELPKSKTPVFLSFAWWQDKPQWENGPWLAPHLAVDMSFDQYRNNQDPVLDAALTFKGDDFMLNPMLHFVDLFEAGKMTELEADAQRMAKDPRYRFFDFNDQFNRVGYDLLQDNAIDQALYVFQLNVKLFPESANAWDSLAEANWKANKLDKAQEYYNKAIALDPNGSVGENARAMLKKMKEGHH